MFDIGSGELLLVSVVALFVLGPERLPRFARKVGLWLAELKKMLVNVKHEVDKQL